MAGKAVIHRIYGLSWRWYHTYDRLLLRKILVDSRYYFKCHFLVKPLAFRGPLSTRIMSFPVAFYQTLWKWLEAYAITKQMAQDSLCQLQCFSCRCSVWILFFWIKHLDRHHILLHLGGMLLDNRIGKSFLYAIHSLKPEATSINWNFSK